MPWQVYNSAGQLLQATDLPDSTVTASKLATNAVTNAKVADDAVGVAELSATGTASNSTFLRGDNAWAAPSGGPSQANQAAIEAETNQDTYIPPDLIKHSPGVAKAWSKFYWNSGTPTQTSGYNISSYTDNATGDCTINFTNSLSGNGCTVGPGFSTQGGGASLNNFGSSGFMRVESVNTSGSNVDQTAQPGQGHAIFGDFA